MAEDPEDDILETDAFTLCPDCGEATEECVCVCTECGAVGESTLCGDCEDEFPDDGDDMDGLDDDGEDEEDEEDD